MVGFRGLLPREVQLALPGKALEVCGYQVLELVQVLRVITQDRDMQAGAIRMQVREAEGKFDATVVVTETDWQLVRKLRTQAADVACRRIGDDMAGGDVQRSDAVAALRVRVALGGQTAHCVARLKMWLLGQGAAARLGMFHSCFPPIMQAQARRLRGVVVRVLARGMTGWRIYSEWDSVKSLLVAWRVCL